MKQNVRFWHLADKSKDAFNALGGKADIEVKGFYFQSGHRSSYLISFQSGVIVLTLEECVRRRDFIKVVAGSAASWPLTARAQKPLKAPVIGVLWPNPPSQFEPIRQGLNDLGYVEGKNIHFEFRWAEGALDKLPEMALELVRIPVDLMVTLAPQATVAARRATHTIPIVFVAMGDPVASGVVASLALPRSEQSEPVRD